MNRNLFQRNRKAFAALLLCVCFAATHPLAAFAEEGTDAVQAMQQQKQSVSGNVKDAAGEPVIGANIREKGNPSNGTITDIDGNFHLQVGRGAVLEVSFIGYKTVEVAVTPGRPVNVILQDDSALLEEVVVVGYGTMRKKDLTGSVVQINPDKIADQNPGSVQDLLRGTPGLQIGYDSSAKGGGSIQLRGQNSLYTDGGHNSPLIILDGMAFNGELSEINPDDIAQIDVLKDASSAAVYGAKAASGVLIITTKKGKEGKPIINIGVNLAANTKAAYRDVFNAEEYMRYREDWFKATTYGYNNSGQWGYYSKESKIPAGYYDHYENASWYGITQNAWATSGPKTLQAGESLKSLYARRMGLDNDAALVMQNFLDDKTYDWNKAVFRTGFNQDYNASISGATDRVNYYLSFGYLNNQGAIQGDNYHAFRSNMKLNAKITDWLEVGANINFQDRSDESNAVPLNGNYWDANQLRESPYALRYDADGNELQYPRSGNPTNGGYNYHFNVQYEELEKGYTVLNTIFNAKLTLPFGITYQFNIAPRYQWFYDRYFMSSALPHSTPSTRGVNRNTSKNFDWSLNNTLTWDKVFDKHRFTVTLVQEAEENRHWYDEIHARNITPTDVLGFHYVSGANMEQSSIYTSDTHSTAAAYLGRLFYSYKDRYMFTGTVRRDGYSAFGSNNPWATFWSVGGSWVFSEESFVNLPWLNSGKLRVSYGTNGNRSLRDTYLALSNLKNGGVMGYYHNGGASVIQALQIDRLGNPNLEWEKTTAYNVGLDFSVLDYRLSGSVEWYYKKTHDMIMAQRLPNFTGFGSITTNLGEVTNSGVEITLNSRNIERKNFTWNTGLGFSYNKNRIKHLYYEYDENGDEINDTSNNWFIGKPIGEIWYWEVDGIWQLDEAAEAAKVNQKPGDPKVVNRYTGDDKADGTPVYNDKDKAYLGMTRPPIYWNLRNDFTFFKDWSFSFSMYSYMGHKSLSGNYLNGDNSGSMFTNTCNTYKKEYWTPENPTNEYARLNAVGPSGATGVQKLYNRSFVRLDNITIGYTLPKELTRKFMLEKVRLTAGINNVCTFDSWEYGDPETGGYANRQFQFGINVTL
ncbi:TonB-linked SusC/RagA family outer membrane protein [Bacteroides zoogleoformans]|uniref:SusC/RagA family protein n=1 Tax=Bacteroides zoogleoformans TaxID=28119 RepID=A0ABM6T7G9_9BACE|nr:TonB-dependent receptor [Bacteroides zoogleoformans]AVM52617.1 SusC/RagA family protein [Bacteroides zoogleoformans]TWJ17713.1 TonB-linked SusC/RagA family outer membrane protein [Bacteroides zoogleoformans]